MSNTFYRGGEKIFREGFATTAPPLVTGLILLSDSLPENDCIDILLIDSLKMCLYESSIVQ